MDKKKNGTDIPNGNGLKVDTDDNEDEVEEERGTWGNQVEFILCSLGYAVGLSNIWRFPYICYTNGGGAFLVPYFLMLFFVGIPMFFMEMVIGQYSGCGPLTIWSIAPLFQGVGLGMMLISTFISVFYTMILGWALYYLFMSCRKTLPWDGCQNYFNTELCYSKKEASPCENANGTWFNQTCFNSTYISTYDTMATTCNETDCYNYTMNPFNDYLVNMSAKVVSSSEDFFNHGMLEKSDRMDDFIELKWELCLALGVGWLLCFLCLIKGIKSSGKAVYFTATFPYVVLLILFIRGVTLPGAVDGIMFYITPQWEFLLKPKVWADAAGQVFFSLSVGAGGLMTFASYNKFNNNIYRDALIVAFGNCLTSVFAGFVIFSILGYMAHTLGKDVADVVSSGSGLAFIAYPEMVTHLPISQLWSVLFFLMLIALGLDSLFAGIEVLMTGVIDVFPSLRKKKMFVALGLCVICYAMGLTLCTRAGIFWLDLIAYYSSGWSVILMALAECIIFAWVYGAANVIDNIEEMVGFRLWKHWWFCWKFITPLLLIVILVMNFYEFTPLKYGDYVMPPWAQVLGWLIALSSVSMIPLVAAFKLCKSSSNPEFAGLSFCQRFVALCKPTKDWKPSTEKRTKTSASQNISTISSPDGIHLQERSNGYVNEAF